jgi:chemotaxis receptor (MCP) glutamine deamidase CheD
MFSTFNFGIGERNVNMVIRELHSLGIYSILSDVGENYGRTMECHARDGKVIVRSMSRGSRIL